MAKSKGYLNQGWGFVVTLILAIIPFTSWILGGITRIMRGKLLWGILNLIPITFPIFWIIDIVSVILNKDLVYLA